MIDMHVETIPYGRGEVTLRIPRRNYVGTLFPTYRSGVEDETGEIRSIILEHTSGIFKSLSNKKSN